MGFQKFLEINYLNSIIKEKLVDLCSLQIFDPTKYNFINKSVLQSKDNYIPNISKNEIKITSFLNVNLKKE